MAGLGRGLGALLSASNRNKAKAGSDGAGLSEDLDLTQASNETVHHGQKKALNNLLSTRMPEPAKSLKKRPYHASRAQVSGSLANENSVDTSNGSVDGSVYGVVNTQTQAAKSAVSTASATSANTSANVAANASSSNSASSSTNAPNTSGSLTSELKMRTVVVESGDTVTPPLKIAETNLVHTILLKNLKASIYQPRTDFSEDSLQELADSIKEHGLLEPLLVARSEENNKYEIICGERRFRAAQMAGLRAVPCLIRELSDAKAYAVALIENIQREDLSPLEIARAYEQMMQKCNYTQDSLAKSLGKARSTVANTLRLLKLEPQVQDALRSGLIDMGHAKILLALSGEHQIDACNTVIEQKLSVAATDVMVKELVKNLKSATQTKDKQASSKKASPRFNNYEKLLNKSLKGVKAKFVVKNESQGKLTLSYTSTKELDYLLKILGIPMPESV